MNPKNVNPYDLSSVAAADRQFRLSDERPVMNPKYVNPYDLSSVAAADRQSPHRSSASLNLEDWMERQRRIQHDVDREMFDATCPACKTDILDALKAAAFDTDGGYGEVCEFECPKCHLEIEYQIDWKYVISSAYRTSPTKEELDEIDN